MQARWRAGLRSFAARSCGSPGGLTQDQLAQGQVRHGTSEPLILLLETLQFLELVYAHPTVRRWARTSGAFNGSRFAPAVRGLFDDTDPPDRIKTGQTLTHQNLNLPQFRHNLFRLRSLVRHS